MSSRDQDERACFASSAGDTAHGDGALYLESKGVLDFWRPRPGTSDTKWDTGRIAGRDRVFVRHLHILFRAGLDWNAELDDGFLGRGRGRRRYVPQLLPPFKTEPGAEIGAACGCSFVRLTRRPCRPCRARRACFACFACFAYFACSGCLRPGTARVDVRGRLRFGICAGMYVRTARPCLCHCPTDCSLVLPWHVVLLGFCVCVCVYVCVCVCVCVLFPFFFSLKLDDVVQLDGGCRTLGEALQATRGISRQRQ
mmetsp:Transcript_3463/g.13726  ORF Transcript_3463/g.13726 Transcript_3463/m.13726 type:complete len:254 (+) Transcript_3463:725-1486(+)